MTDEDGTVWHLHVTEENIGEVLVLVVAGRISNATAGDLGRALARPDNSRLRGIIVDLSAVDYVNSAGLQQLEAAVATRGPRLPRPSARCQSPMHAHSSRSPQAESLLQQAERGLERR